MIASACHNNIGGGSPPDTFPPSCQSTYGAWLNPLVSAAPKNDIGNDPLPSSSTPAEPSCTSVDVFDFEFRLEDPVTMLSADELFSDGKLMPLQLVQVLPPSEPAAAEILSPVVIGSDALVLSPKAPRCTARWREILGLKRMQSPVTEPSRASFSLTASTPRSFEQSPSSKSSTCKSFKHLLHRHSKLSLEPSLSVPLLGVADTEELSSSVSSRLSLSSSSSSAIDHPASPLDSKSPRNAPRVRIAKLISDPTEGHLPARIRRPPEQGTPVMSIDSPRMDPSGRVIFQGLERSSSSPSSFNGGPRAKLRGIERSYSANVRAPSVLNVPVCSLLGSSKSSVSVFGFGQLFSQPRKEKETPSGSATVSRSAKPAVVGINKAVKGRYRPRRRESCGV
ncbi:hypothetical protein HPP92_013543 [Vanilla planifolia]|uniref:Uncharacterized protein n=1 Tax=Vanilla planifolia TaxID=51239 RepID=A0A835UWU1_VANPL|nr:hypothetical protein HPP92_013543 [Vanilla planifolia]